MGRDRGLHLQITLIGASSTILFLILLVPSLTGYAYAEEVKAGIWLVNVDRFDTSTGSYNVDFYIWFRWDASGESEKPINFEFANGRAVSIDIIRE